MLVSAAVHLAANLVLGLMTSRSESWHLEISLDRRVEPKAKAEIPAETLASVRSISDKLAEAGH